MEKEFDFSNIGKRMPYRVPENFFTDMEQRAMEGMRSEASSRAKRKVSTVSMVVKGIAAVAAVVALILMFTPHNAKTEADNFTDVEQAFAHLSSEDQAYMLEVYQEDIFINE